MKDFYKILLQIKSYSAFAFLNIIFNILTVLFSLVSLTMVIPFLGILFGTIESQNISTNSFELNSQSIKDNFYFLINNIINNKEESEALLFICMLILIMFFFRNLFRYLALYFLIPIRNGVVHNLRTRLHKKVLSLPMRFFTDNRKGDLSARMTTDLVEIELSVMSSLEIIFRDPIQILIYLISLIIISPQLTLFVFLLFPITGYIIARVGKSLRQKSKISQYKMGEILSMIDEHISGLKIIKLFNSENSFHQKFKSKSQEYMSLMSSLLRKKDLSSPMSEFLSTIVLVVIMWFGGKFVLDSNSSLTAEEFIAYILIFSQIIPPAKSFTTAYYRIEKGSAAINRIYELINQENKIKDAKAPKKIKDIKEGIFIKDVSFKYENINILSKINIAIPKGKTIALVGESGSGKTTIADLCARFYDVNEGGVYIDKENIKDIKISNLRNLMGVVSQESILFNDSIYNNILVGNHNASKKEVINAAKIANAHQFILKAENSYETNIGERGEKLSGGQKQRISIARAILKNPSFLILDEATSSLDNENERLVQDALTNLMYKRTTLIIAHRLSTIKNADKIIVLSKGKIIGEGTHNELSSNNLYYKKLLNIGEKV